MSALNVHAMRVSAGHLTSFRCSFCDRTKMDETPPDRRLQTGYHQAIVPACRRLVPGSSEENGMRHTC